MSLDNAIKQVETLKNFTAQAPKVVKETINELANQTLAELNEASVSDIPEDWCIYKLSEDHGLRMPKGDICDVYATTLNEECNNIPGVFRCEDAPKPPIHERCNCTLTSLKEEKKKQMVWTVIIEDDTVKFTTNENKELDEKILGTAATIDAMGNMVEGKEPSNFADEIIESFQVRLAAEVRTRLTALLEQR